MTDYLPQAPTPQLAAAFPTQVIDVERLVYEYVRDAAAQGVASGLPALSFYPDRARSATEGRKVPVAKGWPAFPGKVPAIGVAAGPETEDQQHDSIEGGFAGTVYATDTVTGLVVGAADYYAEPIYSPIIVTLMHENRDERDRLHVELRRLLNPLKTDLLRASPRINRVRLDAEKSEQDGGPPQAEQPFWLYFSLFTVHVYHEMLEARNVAGPDGILQRIDVTVTPV